MGVTERFGCRVPGSTDPLNVTHRLRGHLMTRDPRCGTGRAATDSIPAGSPSDLPRCPWLGTWVVNHIKVQRLWRHEGLRVPVRPHRRKTRAGVVRIRLANSQRRGRLRLRRAGDVSAASSEAQRRNAASSTRDHRCHRYGRRALWRSAWPDGDVESQPQRDSLLVTIPLRSWETDTRPVYASSHFTCRARIGWLISPDGCSPGSGFVTPTDIGQRHAIQKHLGYVFGVEAHVFFVCRGQLGGHQ
jgi:hypothetical protein